MNRAWGVLGPGAASTNNGRFSNWPWVGLLWAGAACSVAGMAIFLPVGWDSALYQQAIKDLHDGLDPYVVGTVCFGTHAVSGGPRQFFLYPPITLKVLQLAGLIPAIPARLLYCLIYAVGFGCQLWAGFKLALPSERHILKYALPLVAFFPGFMPNEVILCGNIAFFLYGIVLAAAVRGWERNRWGWFYFAVVAASLIKPPFLVFLAVPLLAGCQQISKSIAVGGLGVVLFAGQKVLWPYQFGEYLQTLHTASTCRSAAGHFESFGLSAAGVLASALHGTGRPVVLPSLLFYLCYGCLFFATLVYFSQQYRIGRIGSQSWLTVLLLGTFLLSPRILQYDALPATVPMFLLALRGWKDASARWIVGVGLVGAVAALAFNQDGLEISLAMWSLLLSGLILLRRDLSLAFTPATPPIKEPGEELLVTP